MSKYLALDTSSSALYALAVNGDRVSLRVSENCAASHSVILMGEADAALAEAGLRPSECDFFAAVTGPGSFTGIRIGISAAKGFAAACGKPLLGVTAFDTLAVLDERHYAVVLDAGRGGFYFCEYTDGKAGEPLVLSREETEKSGLVLCGDGDTELKNYVKVKRDIKACVERHKDCLSDGIAALYIRKSQAEENRK